MYFDDIKKVTSSSSKLKLWEVSIKHFLDKNHLTFPPKRYTKFSFNCSKAKVLPYNIVSH